MQFPEHIARVFRMAGQLIGELKFNSVCEVIRDGQRSVLKRRRWYAPALTVAGNIYIRLFRLRIRILHSGAWLQREQTAYRVLYREKISVSPGRWLEMPWLGETLSLLLEDPGRTDPEKLRALASATADLYRIHGLETEEEGYLRRFSHGDAGARNVAVDPQTGRAHWFDFEIVHPHGLSDDWRHADDLRALMFSALKAVPESLFDRAVECIVNAYPDAGVLECLRQRIAGGELDFDTYHLAQTQMSAGLHRKVAGVMLRHLDLSTRGRVCDWSCSNDYGTVSGPQCLAPEGG